MYLSRRVEKEKLESEPPSLANLGIAKLPAPRSSAMPLKNSLIISSGKVSTASNPHAASQIGKLKILNMMFKMEFSIPKAKRQRSSRGFKKKEATIFARLYA